eukprot:14406747-Heterocapsa_arctica.AAC.1
MEGTQKKKHQMAALRSRDWGWGPPAHLQDSNEEPKSGYDARYPAVSRAFVLQPFSLRGERNRYGGPVPLRPLLAGVGGTGLGNQQ